MRELPTTLSLPLDWAGGGFRCGPTSIAVGLGVPAYIAETAFKVQRRYVVLHGNRVDAVAPMAISAVLAGFGVRAQYLDLEFRSDQPTIAQWLRGRPDEWRRSTVLVATVDHLLVVRGGQVVDTYDEVTTELTYTRRRARVCDVWRLFE